MFTGVIREIAKANLIGNKIKINAKYKPNIGDSVAINGACLSVVKVDSNSFEVDISSESKKVIALENYNNNNVHIEPAMKLSDRLEGHILQGHIDCKGKIEKIIKNGISYDFFISIPTEFMKFIIPKGSIAIDGVSLTINDVFKDSFRLTIIPITIENTLFKEYKIGRIVNIETDMFARYIYHIFKDKKSISWDDVDAIMARWM